MHGFQFVARGAINEPLQRYGNDVLLPRDRSALQLLHLGDEFRPQNSYARNADGKKEHGCFAVWDVAVVVSDINRHVSCRPQEDGAPLFPTRSIVDGQDSGVA
jgi:hypothetical protein